MLQNGAGLVLTGGGAKLRHIVELCQYDLGLSTRIGIPCIGFSDSLSNELKQPQYSTSLGLLKYGIEEQTKEFHVDDQKEEFDNRDDDFQQTETKFFDDKEKKGRKLLEGFKSTLTKLFEQIS